MYDSMNVFMHFSSFLLQGCFKHICTNVQKSQVSKKKMCTTLVYDCSVCRMLAKIVAVVFTFSALSQCGLSVMFSK